jgi:hypothetical protein
MRILASILFSAALALYYLGWKNVVKETDRSSSTPKGLLASGKDPT